jgi:ferrochelatase
MNSKKVGVLLINVGTPQSPQVRDVRTYLKEFLSDPRVIDIPSFFRWLLLYFFILPFRPKKSARAYASIWDNERGSPLLYYSESLAQKLNELLPKDHIVKVAMRYGNPSIQEALDFFKKQNITNLVICPLFPQYSSAATGSALEEVLKEIKSDWNIPAISTLPPFYAHPLFIQSFARRMEEFIPSQEEVDFLLFSYHGLPERHILKSDTLKAHCLKSPSCCEEDTPFNVYCYRSQSFKTTKLLLKALHLSNTPHATTFQSRLGRSPWIKPYTDKFLHDLYYKKNVRRLVVVCPSFVTDCLETLEEVNIRLKNDWMSLGGTSFTFVPCLNDESYWAESLSHMIKEL